jgi:hypothetical protein
MSLGLEWLQCYEATTREISEHICTRSVEGAVKSQEVRYIFPNRELSMLTFRCASDIITKILYKVRYGAICPRMLLCNWDTCRMLRSESELY